MLKTFMKYLNEIIGERFSVLDDRYVSDIMTDLGSDIEAELENFYELRFVLLDGAIGQLESRTLYEDASDALRESESGRHGEACVVGILLVERPEVLRPRPASAASIADGSPSPAVPTSTRPTAAPSDTPPPDGPWTDERWQAARGDSRWAAERWAAGMRDRCRRYPTLHAEEKIRLAMDILWDVNETWDHDTLLHYPPELPSFDEYLAGIGSNLYAVRWHRPDHSPSAPDGDAA